MGGFVKQIRTCGFSNPQKLYKKKTQKPRKTVRNLPSPTITHLEGFVKLIKKTHTLTCEIHYGKRFY